MKTDKKYIIYALLVLIVFLAAYEFRDVKEYTTKEKIIKKFDEDSFNIYLKTDELNTTYARYWGFAPIIVDKNESNSTKVLLEIVKKENENVLCISASCFRLIGIYHDVNHSYITLFNPKLKEKVKSYRAKEILENSVLIDHIYNDSVALKDLNSTRNWEFKIFDVNDSKYKPKEISND